jgi:hypothetical protein
MQRKRGLKKGQSLATFVLVELVLATLVIFILWVAIDGMIDGNTFFQNFYAKDNAHLIEAVHGVPNGAIYVGYLWDNPAFRVHFNQDNVEVRLATIAEDKQGTYAGKKAFGASEHTPIKSEGPFAPQYYQIVRTQVPAQIEIQKNFNLATCKTTITELRGISGVGSGSFQGRSGSDYMNDILGAVEAQQRIPDFTKRGVTIHLQVEESETPEIQVYNTTSSDVVERLTCLIVKDASLQRAVTTENYNGPFTENIVIVVKTKDGAELVALKQHILKAVKEYGERS